MTHEDSGQRQMIEGSLVDCVAQFLEVPDVSAMLSTCLSWRTPALLDSSSVVWKQICMNSNRALAQSIFDATHITDYRRLAQFTWTHSDVRTWPLPRHQNEPAARDPITLGDAPTLRLADIVAVFDLYVEEQGHVRQIGCITCSLDADGKFQGIAPEAQRPTIVPEAADSAVPSFRPNVYIQLGTSTADHWLFQSVRARVVLFRKDTMRSILLRDVSRRLEFTFSNMDLNSVDESSNSGDDDDDDDDHDAEDDEEGDDGAAEQSLQLVHRGTRTLPLDPSSLHGKNAVAMLMFELESFGIGFNTSIHLTKDAATPHEPLRNEGGMQTPRSIRPPTPLKAHVDSCSVDVVAKVERGGRVTYRHCLSQRQLLLALEGLQWK